MIIFTKSLEQYYFIMNASQVFMFAITFAVTFVEVSCSKRCDSNADCDFQGECADGSCLCSIACRNSGLIMLCGDDGNYYLNFCYVMMKSCENQTEVKVHWVGEHERCASHPYAPYVDTISKTRLNYPACELKSNHCENFGVCVQNEQPFCLCPPGYGGQRCQSRVEADTDISFTRGLPESMVGEVTRKQSRSDVIMLLCLCTLSAMFSAVVTSAICQRIRYIRMRRLLRNTDDRAVPGKIKDCKKDSRMDLSFFVEDKPENERVFTIFNKISNLNETFDA